MATLEQTQTEVINISENKMPKRLASVALPGAVGYVPVADNISNRNVSFVPPGSLSFTGLTVEMDNIIFGEVTIDAVLPDRKYLGNTLAMHVVDNYGNVLMAE